VQASKPYPDVFLGAARSLGRAVGSIDEESKLWSRMQSSMSSEMINSSTPTDKGDLICRDR